MNMFCILKINFGIFLGYKVKHARVIQLSLYIHFSKYVQKVYIYISIYNWSINLTDPITWQICINNKIYEMCLHLFILTVHSYVFSCNLHLAFPPHLWAILRSQQTSWEPQLYTSFYTILTFICLDSLWNIVSLSFNITFCQALLPSALV